MNAGSAEAGNTLGPELFELGPRLQAAACELLSLAGEGGTVVVRSMDPLARNLDDLRYLAVEAQAVACQMIASVRNSRVREPSGPQKWRVKGEL
ncbi:hypothetical protein AB0N65_11480 [Paenarthrobacter sp. NPDC089322]|uniref:hypothetical protein n=1 Tax=Paenarthrobacter sp. NPDC089322 TaxID=3155065 RepID=UPI0034237F87